MITPFTEDGIDFDRMEMLLERQASGGTKAVVIAGTTGEIATLKDREYESLAVFSVQKAAGRMKVILGIGGNNTEKCLENAAFARRIGADAVLMTPPYYNKTSPDGLAEHFLYVADRVDIPLILYNVPSRTAIGIPAAAYKRLAAHPNVNGIKEASGDFSLIAELASDCAGDLWLWSGNDDHTIPMMSLGALGVISVASNLLPKTVSELCHDCLCGDFEAANALYRRCSALFRMLFVETNPIPVKAAMSMRSLDSGLLRRPLVPLSASHEAAMRDLLLRCESLE